MGNSLSSMITAKEMLAGVLNALCGFVEFSESKQAILFGNLRLNLLKVLIYVKVVFWQMV